MSVKGFIMERIIKLFSKKRNLYIFLFTVTFLVAALPILRLNTLTLSDELGTIVNSTMLSGHKWTVFIENYSLAYYKFGISLLFYPIFVVIHSPSVAYQLCLLICAILISIIPVIVYYIRASLISVNENHIDFFGIAIALIIGFLPSSLLWSKSVWAESLIILMPWVQLLILIKLHNEKNQKKINLLTVLLALTTLIGYSSHQRGISILVTIFLVIFLIRFISRKWIVNYKLFIPLLALGLVIEKLMSSFFKNNIWGAVNSGQVTNTIGKVISDLRLDVMFSWTGIKTFVNLIFGWIFSAISSTYGLFAIGFVLCLIYFIKRLSHARISKEVLPYDTLIFYVVLYFVSTFAIGIIFFFPAGLDVLYESATDRLDKMIYCRYICSSFGPIIFVALNEILSRKSDELKRGLKYSSVFVVLNLFVCLIFMSDDLRNGVVSLLQVTPLPLLTKANSTGLELYTDFDHNIVYAGIIVLIFYLILLLLIKRRNNKIVCCLLITIYSIQYCYGLTSYYFPVNDYNDHAVSIAEDILDSLEDSNINFTVMTNVPRTAYAYQFAYPDFNVAHPDNESIYENIIVIDEENDINFSNKGYFSVVGYENIYLRGALLKEELIELGFDIVDI